MKTTRINWGGWLILLTCLALIGGISSLTVSLTKSEANQVAQAYVPKMVAISLANKSLSQAFNETLQAILESDQTARASLMASVANQSERTTQHLDAFAKLVRSAKEKELFAVLVEARQQYFSVRDQVFAALSGGDRLKAEDMYQSLLRPAFARYEQHSLDLLQRNADDAIGKSESVVNRAFVLQLVVAAIAAALFLVGFGVGLFTGIHSGKTR
jgi:hypothetical protein